MSQTSRVTDLGVGVDEDVAERDDALVFADSLGDRCVDFRQLRQRLADNREGPLHRETQHGLTLVVGELFARGEPRDVAPRRARYRTSTSWSQAA